MFLSQSVVLVNYAHLFIKKKIMKVGRYQNFEIIKIDIL